LLVMIPSSRYQPNRSFFISALVTHCHPTEVFSLPIIHIPTNEFDLSLYVEDDTNQRFQLA
jgi:hypothetical protein